MPFFTKTRPDTRVAYHEQARSQFNHHCYFITDDYWIAELQTYASMWVSKLTIAGNCIFAVVMSVLFYITKERQSLHMYIIKNINTNQKFD